MKKLFLVAVIAMMVIGSVSALTVDFGDEPTSWGGGILTDELENQLRDKVTEKYGKYEHGDDLGRGIANANALAADSGYMKGAWGYEYFTASVSCNGALVIDGQSLGEFNTDFLDDYKETGNEYMGAGLQMINASVGFNLGHLLGWEHGLYVTLKAGMSKFDWKEFEFDSYNMGFMLNYQLVQEKELAKLLTWRGLNVGTGLNYYNSTMKWTVDDLEDVRVTTSGSAYAEYKTDLDVEAKNSSFIIPLEISTGLKAAIFEFYGGLGADFQFGGENEIEADTKARVRYYDGSAYSSDETWGRLKLKSDGDVDHFRGKFFAGFGFTMGPVHIEIPYAQYFDEAYSASIGIIGGVAF